MSATEALLEAYIGNVGALGDGPRPSPRGGVASREALAAALEAKLARGATALRVAVVLLVVLFALLAWPLWQQGVGATGAQFSRAFSGGAMLLIINRMLDVHREREAMQIALHLALLAPDEQSARRAMVELLAALSSRLEHGARPPRAEAWRQEAPPAGSRAGRR